MTRLCIGALSLFRPLAGAALCLLAADLIWSANAESYQPKSNVTRGIYADLDRALQSGVWRLSGSGAEIVDNASHTGRSCAHCRSRSAADYQGLSQTILMKQEQPRPIKIAGWSRARNVQGQKSYRYSIYVDFVLADGKSWPMKIVAFEPGTHDWQYGETVVTPPQPVKQAALHVFVRQTAGEAWFDDLFLGEVGGKNLVLSPGFEEQDRTNRAGQAKLLEDLDALRCNAIHGYLSSRLDDWNVAPSPKSEIVQLLRTAADRGIGVWLTLGLAPLPIRNTADPNFPQYECVNGPWGQRWVELMGRVARYPFAGLSMVPDEYNWNTGELKQHFEKHPDAKVRDFYAKLGNYCDCPCCRRKYTAKYGVPFPPALPYILPSAELPYRRWLQFRYDSTTDWIARSCAAAKKANPLIRTDSLICVSPICSDFWYGSGVAWDRAGYEAGLEYPTTDPYILLHNYLGDSTHWYVTETTEHLAGSSPQRRCGVVLEGSRLRREYRELDPVEIYGSALSAVWHGARELAWFHHSVVMNTNRVTDRPEVSQACIRGVYGLLERMDPWLAEVRPEPGVALLFSRASCDAWRMHVQGKKTEPALDTRGIEDPRYASIAQKEVLYYLLRSGYPTTLYYLESVRKEELAGHRVIVVSLPLAISQAQAGLLAELAAEGHRVIVLGTDGPLEEDGAVRDRPALADLLAGARPAVPASPSADPAAWLGETKRGRGSVVFIGPAVLDRLMSHRENEKRTRAVRILPSQIDQAAAQVLTRALAGKPLLPRPLLAGRLPEGDDVELCCCVNRQGQRLLLAINWDQRPRSVCLRNDPGFDGPAREAYCLGSDGQWSPWQGSFRPELRLEPQQALVAVLKR